MGKSYIADMHGEKIYDCYINGSKHGFVEAKNEEAALEKAIFRFGMEVDIVLRKES